MKRKHHSSKWSMRDFAIILLLACSSLGGFFDSWLLAAVFAVPALLLASWSLWQHRKPVTRWAKKHPIQTRVLITLIQFGLMGLGLLIGHNLYQLGVVLPEATYWVFGGLMIIGFTRVPFLRKKARLILPSQLRKNRLVYAGLGLCLVGIMSYAGNRLEKDLPTFFLTKAVLSIDNQMFPSWEEAGVGLEESSVEAWSVFLASEAGNQAQLSEKEVRKAQRIQQKIERRRERKGFLALAGTGVGGLLLGLSLAVCFGVCVAGGGIVLLGAAIGGSIAGGGAILGVLGGLAGFGLGFLITRASIQAIRRTGLPPEKDS